VTLLNAYALYKYVYLSIYLHESVCRARGSGSGCITQLEVMDPCRREAWKAEARPEKPRAEVGFPTADQGFSSIRGTLFDFYGI